MNFSYFPIRRCDRMTEWLDEQLCTQFVLAHIHEFTQTKYREYLMRSMSGALFIWFKFGKSFFSFFFFLLFVRLSWTVKKHDKDQIKSQFNIISSLFYRSQRVISSAVWNGHSFVVWNKVKEVNRNCWHENINHWYRQYIDGLQRILIRSKWKSFSFFLSGKLLVLSFSCRN